MTLYKLEEWQAANGWTCEHTSSYPKNIQKWVIPARLMGLSADDFIKVLIEKYHPDKIYHNDDCSFVSWFWNKQSDMRKFKNDINALSRQKKFMI